MKIRETLLVGLLLLCYLLPPVTGSVQFEGGKDEVIADLAAPGFGAVVNVAVPADYYVKNATMNVTGMAADGNSSAYPENVMLSLNNTPIWSFQGTGYGPLGCQNSFTTGLKNDQFSFGNGGGSQKACIRLPKDAEVQSATVALNSTPRTGMHELMEFTGGAAGDGLSSWGHMNAGDVNNDGYDDIIIGAGGNDSGGLNSGCAYLYFGGPNMDNIADVVFTGGAAGEFLGSEAAGAGDVNNDGYDDVIVGAYGNNSGGSGRALIYLGGPNMDNIVDVVLTEGASSDCFGNLVSGAGDVNNDGYDDVVVSAPYNDSGGNDSGRAYLYLGGQNMDNVPDVIFQGAAVLDYFGTWVSGAGDVNNDNYDDVIIGAPYNDAGGSNAGSAYIYYGGQNMDGNADLLLTGAAAGDYFGQWISDAGDVNNDGYGDVIIGAYGSNAGTGSAYIYLGGQNMDNIPDVVFNGIGVGDEFGYCSGAGDVNNDGYDDVIVGAEFNDAGNTDAGSAYLYLGGQNMDNVVDWNISGTAVDDELCIVSGAGDVNNDGFDEILIGVPYNDDGGIDSGCVYLYSASNIPIYQPNITIGSKTIWNKSGNFNGTETSGDFSSLLNDYLQSAGVSGNDTDGNSYVDVPLKVSSKSEGDLTLSNLKITYRYNATVPDFAPALSVYIAAHQADKDSSGNISVPITVISSSAGKIRLYGLNLERDLAPILIGNISNAELEENSANVTLIDLYQYFRDDCDKNSALDFSIISASNSSFVRLWITAKRYLSADAMTGDANDNWTGTVEAKIACYDHWGQKTESNQFQIIIKPVNNAPVITSVPPTIAEAGVLYEYNVTSVDGDNDIVHYNLTESPTGMTIDHDLGKIRWMPVARGIFNVTVTVDDGIAQTGQSFNITVPNKIPKITSTPLLNGTVGVPYSYNVTAEDTNLDILNFSLSSAPDGMQIESTTGAIAWTPSKMGDFAVSISVSDGLGQIFQNFTINVSEPTQVNWAPQFNSAPILTATVDMPYVYNASAVDADLDTLTFSLESGPQGMTVEPTIGKITWTPTTAGNFTVKLKVSDGKGGEGKQEFTIKVSPAIRPQIVMTRPQTGKSLKGTVTFSGTVTKGSRDVVQVQIRIDGKEWSNAAGNYSWSYGLDTKTLKNGKHTFEFRAYDGKEYSDVLTQEFKVDNVSGGGKGFIPMIDSTTAILLCLGVNILLFWKRKRG